MRLKKALELKEHILGRYYKDIIGVSPRLRAQSEPPIERSERRIAVGLAKLESGYRVEIRIQRKGGAAQSMTNELKKKHGDDINVEVLENLEIPPISSIRQLIQRKPLQMQSRRPLEIGTSVGHVDGGPGTLGALVEYKGKDAVLSNAHVLAPQGAAKKNPIFQPGREGSQPPDADRIGELSNWIHFSKTGANTVDAAICLLDEIEDGAELHSSNLIPDWCGAACRGRKIRGVQSALDMRLGTVLAKVGRTTGYTEGILTAASMSDLTVKYHGIGNHRFDNAIEVTWDDLRQPFTRPGDSGSLVFDPRSMKAVGLHFAGGKIKRDGKKIGVSYACDIASVFSSLKCSLIL